MASTHHEECHGLCEAGLRGHQNWGLTEGLDVLHGIFRRALVTNGPYEAAFATSEAMEAEVSLKVFTFWMASEASRGKMCVWASSAGGERVPASEATLPPEASQ